MSASLSADSPPGNRHGRLRTVVFAFVAITLAGVAFLAHAISEIHQEPIRRSQEDLNRQLISLRAGQTKSVHLYETIRTNALLEQLEGMAEVEELNLELTDVSDAGMESVATLPRLRKLVIHGGRYGVSNQGLAILKGKQSLETLELTNTKVTDDGLKVLRELPNLRALTLYYEPLRGERLTDAGLVHLKKLPKLKSLTLTGGWASAKAVADLQATLPHCEVNRGGEAEGTRVNKTQRRP